jgi:hypothetical protein
MKQPIIKLDKALAAWGTPRFNEVLKREIEALDAERLPLQQGLSQGNAVSDSGFSAMIIRVWEEDEVIGARSGIFYKGIIAGCSCADDPTPVDEHAEYCVLQLAIDRRTAATTVALVAD